MSEDIESNRSDKRQPSTTAIGPFFSLLFSIGSNFSLILFCFNNRIASDSNKVLITY